MKLNGYLCDLCGFIVDRNYCNLLFVGTSDIGTIELCPRCYKVLNAKIKEEIKIIKKNKGVELDG